jgi:hypothetical protein
MTDLRIEGYDLDLDQIEAAIAEYRSIVSGRAERLGIDLQKAIALGVCMFLTGYLEDDPRYSALPADEADALIERMARTISRMLEPSPNDLRDDRDAHVDSGRNGATQPGSGRAGVPTLPGSFVAVGDAGGGEHELPDVNGTGAERAGAG